MRVARIFRRFGELSWRERGSLGEALFALAIASAAIRLLPFRHVVRLARKPARPRAGSDAERIVRARWAVEVVAARVPWRTVCFQKGVALHGMLHRRGIASQLHYGAKMEPRGGMKAHVWVTFRGNDVIGGAEAVGFPCLATYE
ncbi:MAG: lasso peptide biosynthesis B2 protein [Sphingomonadales bacterium]|nr:MAG: lasso peptide biosynthesis B2 protein [Sphingomonadales bacterium]